MLDILIDNMIELFGRCFVNRRLLLIEHNCFQFYSHIHIRQTSYNHNTIRKSARFPAFNLILMISFHETILDLVTFYISFIHKSLRLKTQQKLMGSLYIWNYISKSTLKNDFLLNFTANLITSTFQSSKFHSCYALKKFYGRRHRLVKTNTRYLSLKWVNN